MWRSRREDSNRFDLGLLRRFARYRALFSLGHLTRIGLPDSVGATSARLDTAVADVSCDLSASTPPTQRVRLAGRLDTMGASQGVLKLELQRGAEVYGLWEGDGPVDWLKDYSNRDVVIEGRVVYRPSGALLRVEVQAIGMATAADDYFRVMPGAGCRATPCAWRDCGRARGRPLRASWVVSRRKKAMRTFSRRSKT